MLTMETWQQIRSLKACGASEREISRQLQISRNTVRKAVVDPLPPKYARPATAGASLAEPTRNRSLIPGEADHWFHTKVITLPAGSARRG